MKFNNPNQKAESEQRSLSENESSSELSMVTRRRFLATTGAVGLASTASVATMGGVASADPGEHLLEIQGMGERAGYSFAVDGNLEKTSGGGANINSNDIISENGASGEVGRAADAYTFDGDLLAFKLDGEANVLLDGEAAHVGRRPDYFLEIQGTGERARYSFAVEDNLEKSTGHVANINANDEIENQRGRGEVGAAADAYTFDGALHAFDIRGVMRVLLNGAPAHVGRRPDHVITFRGTGEPAQYDFTVDGNLAKTTAYGANINANDTISGTRARGEVGTGADSYTYTGGISRFDLDGSADVLIDSVGTLRSQ